AVGLGHAELVLHHDVVEAGALEHLGDLDEELARPGRAAVGEGLVPEVGREVQEPSQMELLGWHSALSSNQPRRAASGRGPRYWPAGTRARSVRSACTRLSSSRLALSEGWPSTKSADTR